MSKTLAAYLAEWQPQPIDQAVTLPAELYCSPEAYQLEQRQVFGKAWYYVGHTSQLSEPGSFFTIEIAQQPLVILKTKAEELRGFFNVCPHRAGPVAQGSGKCNRLICQYHAWNFDLEGNLRHAPEMHDAIEFNASRYSLTAVQVETWGPFIFVNLDASAPSLLSALGDIPASFERYQFDRLVRIHSADYWTDVNWKIFEEITCDIYHEPILHAATLGQYYQCPKASGSVRNSCYFEHVPLLIKERNSDDRSLYIDTLNEVEQQCFNMVCLFPNFSLLMSPDCCLTFLVDPQSVSKTRIRVDWLVPNTDQAKSPENVQQLVQLFDELMQEDLDLLPILQMRIGSLGYRQAQFCPTREIGVHWFQESLMQYLTRPAKCSSPLLV